MTKHNRTEEASAMVNRGGRPRALTPSDIQVLLKIVAEHPQASLDEIANELYRQSGLQVVPLRLDAAYVLMASYG
ncbi:helix-turn-helix domain-containing protein [Pseudomonas asuensis]